ncbi:hypothetical protein [Bufonid herpesvirus 1]|uniref:hypothetical protein n=1 Tax=Bufonid herpesvirus 1 TaxID=2282206 RepID=UPI000EB7128F|nr:hypothetical protein [Bufonid herpesvirus 1]AXF48630.1 hypothetical protein [Bufonid herpesvirus 1]
MLLKDPFPKTFKTVFGTFSTEDFCPTLQQPIMTLFSSQRYIPGGTISVPDVSILIVSKSDGSKVLCNLGRQAKAQDIQGCVDLASALSGFLKETPCIFNTVSLRAVGQYTKSDALQPKCFSHMKNLSPLCTRHNPELERIKYPSLVS